eukprot:6202504-Pleurochrysis_carterae.AAC.1
MRALYNPHRGGSGDPNERVVPNEENTDQLAYHAALVASSGGAHFTASLTTADAEALPNIVTAFADAATDSCPPGIGGYCHGMYWYMELQPVHVQWLHITALELLATGFNALAFAEYFAGAWDVVLMSDALATPR